MHDKRTNTHIVMRAGGAFHVQIVETFSDRQDAYDREAYLINLLKPAGNVVGVVPPESVGQIPRGRPRKIKISAFRVAVKPEGREFPTLSAAARAYGVSKAAASLSFNTGKPMPRKGILFCAVPNEMET